MHVSWLLSQHRSRGTNGLRACPIETKFRSDVFTFVRVQYDSNGVVHRGRNWDNDFADCDWTCSVHLHELTSVEVDPDGRVLWLTDSELPDYPFVYMSNVGRMSLNDDAATALRRYLLNGGFLMVDDFWGPQAWQHVQTQLSHLFPDREPRELSGAHPILSFVYDLQVRIQVPSIFAWRQSHTFEYWHGDPQGDEGSILLRYV